MQRLKDWFEAASTLDFSDRRGMFHYIFGAGRWAHCIQQDSWMASNRKKPGLVDLSRKGPTGRIPGNSELMGSLKIPTWKNTGSLTAAEPGPQE